MKGGRLAHATSETEGKRVVNGLLIGIQLVVTVVVGVYFYRQLKQQKKAQPIARRESCREMESCCVLIYMIQIDIP